MGAPGVVADEVEAARTARVSRSDLAEAARYAGLVFLTMRAALTLLGILAVALIQSPDGATVTPGWHNLLGAWNRWDAEWFLGIARQGYDFENGSGQGPAAFFPLYPLVVRGVAAVTGGAYLGAGLLVSNLFAYLALVAMYALSRLEFGIPVARRATLYLAVFPTAFFLVAPYSESLFLFAVLVSFIAARRGAWGIAALAGAAATATRSIGVVLVPALLMEALLQHLERGRRSEARVGSLAWSLFCSFATTAGAFAYFLYWRIEAGDWLVPLRSQSGWQREYAFLPDALWEGTKIAFQFIGAYSGGYHQVDWLLVVLSLACAVWIVAKVRLSYVVFTLLSLLGPLILIFPARPFMSMPRFVLVIFPLYWAVTRFAERFRAHTLVTAVSAGALGMLALLFVGSYFIF